MVYAYRVKPRPRAARLNSVLCLLNTSPTALMACSKRELLEGAYKFHCKGCNSYQEAQKWVDLKSCPPVLIVHLNRLTFLQHLSREQKVKHRVEFGNYLTPPNIMDSEDGGADVESEDGGGPRYRLLAVVVHMGASAAHGAPPQLLHPAHSHPPQAHPSHGEGCAGCLRVSCGHSCMRSQYRGAGACFPEQPHDTRFATHAGDRMSLW